MLPPVDSEKEVADRNHHWIPGRTDVAATKVRITFRVSWVIAISMNTEFKQIENQSIETCLLHWKFWVLDCWWEHTYF